MNAKKVNDLLETIQFGLEVAEYKTTGNEWYNNTPDEDVTAALAALKALCEILAPKDEWYIWKQLEHVTVWHNEARQLMRVNGIEYEDEDAAMDEAVRQNTLHPYSVIVKRGIRSSDFPDWCVKCPDCGHTSSACDCEENRAAYDALYSDEEKDSMHDCDASSTFNNDDF